MKEYNEYIYKRGSSPHSKQPERPWVDGCTCRPCVRQREIDYNSYKKITEMRKHPSLQSAAVGTALSAIRLLLKKHKDYGPNSISKAPGGALNGLIVRMHDKIERADNLIRNNVEPNNESLKDTFTDMLNYSIIALLVLSNEWDNLQ